MPNAPSANMALITPVEDSSTDAGDWDRLLNDCFELIDLHDHSSGKGVRVPTSGLNINAALEMNSNRLTEIAGLAMDNLGAVLTSGARELFVSSGNLYYRNNSGQNVRLTSGATIDVSSVQGIGGDYASVGAEVAYVDADDTYTFKQEVASAVRQWARGAMGGVDLYEYLAAGDVTIISNRVRLQSPATLAASYAITFPAALPGSTLLMQLSSAGAITASNTIANAVSMSSTLGVTGLITATGGLTAAANQHVTVSGTGELKHGDRVLQIPLTSGVNNATASWDFYSSVAGAAVVWATPTAGSSDDLVFSIPLKVGDRIKEVRARVQDTTGGFTISMFVHKWSGTNMLAGGSQVGATQTSAGDGSVQSLALTGLTETVASMTFYAVALRNNGATVTTHRIAGLEVTYDRP